ncbi:MAG: hypothetical protein PW786_06505 [Arachidicoccus sp.]|nr:hypothetical protein [Arachidicoccus sp.]
MKAKQFVVMRHILTLKNYPTEFINSHINNGFVADLSTFIESSKIHYWIYQKYPDIQY